jgi:hypothetical protein
MYGPDGKVYAQDDGVRRDSSVEKLAKLRTRSSTAPTAT